MAVKRENDGLKVLARMRIVSRTQYAGETSSWDPFYVEEKEVELTPMMTTGDETRLSGAEKKQLLVSGHRYSVSVIWRVSTCLGTFYAEKEIEKLGKTLVM